MKKPFLFFFAAFLLAASCVGTNAADRAKLPASDVASVSFSGISNEQLEKTVTLGNFFIIYFNAFSADIPDSYRYTNVLYTNVSSGTAVYDALQKGIYLNLIQNLSASLKLSSPVTEDDLAKTVAADFNEDIAYTSGKMLTYRTLLYTVVQLRNQIETDSSGAPTMYTGSVGVS